MLRQFDDAVGAGDAPGDVALVETHDVVPLAGRRRLSSVLLAAAAVALLVLATVAGLIAGAGLPEYAVPSAIYGIVMYAVTLPAIFLLLRRASPEPGA